MKFMVDHPAARVFTTLKSFALKRLGYLYDKGIGDMTDSLEGAMNAIAVGNKNLAKENAWNFSKGLVDTLKTIGLVLGGEALLNSMWDEFKNLIRSLYTDEEKKKHYMSRYAEGLFGKNLPSFLSDDGFGSSLAYNMIEELLGVFPFLNPYAVGKGVETGNVWEIVNEGFGLPPVAGTGVVEDVIEAIQGDDKKAREFDTLQDLGILKEFIYMKPKKKRKSKSKKTLPKPLF